MIRVLIADDHAAVREGLVRSLVDQGKMEVVGQASNGFEAVEMAKAGRPEVVLLDALMPGRGGLETLKELKRALPETRVLILSMLPEDQFAVRFLREGADGYLSKEVAPDQLVGAIRQIHGGEKYISPQFAERLAFLVALGPRGQSHDFLSVQEFQVLCLIGSGLTITEIGDDLCLSVETVSTYRLRILQKMGLETTAQLVYYAVHEGLVLPRAG